MDLVSPNSCELQQFALPAFIHNGDVIQLIQSIARSLQFAGLYVPDADRALSEIANGHQVLAILAESNRLHSFWMELELLLNCEIGG